MTIRFDIPAAVEEAVRSVNGDAVIPLIDQGEIAAISLALEVGATWLLVDDGPARKAAGRRGLAIVGTIGVLEWAAARGLLDVRNAFVELLATDFCVDAAIIEERLRLFQNRVTPGDAASSAPRSSQFRGHGHPSTPVNIPRRGKARFSTKTNLGNGHPEKTAKPRNSRLPAVCRGHPLYPVLNKFGSLPTLITIFERAAATPARAGTPHCARSFECRKNRQPLTRN